MPLLTYPDGGTPQMYVLASSLGYVWDVNSLSWVKATASGGGGGGAATIADGADVAEGSTADAAWVSGSGTVISLLKKIASAGGSAVSIADGSNVVEGVTTDAAVVSDANGTLSGKLRGLVKILADVWNSGSHWLRVDGSGVTQPVSIAGTVTTTGGLTDTQLRATAVPVSGTFFQGTQPVSIAGTVTVTGGLTDTQLRASAVPVTANAGTNLNTSLLALEAGGNLAAIKADVDKIPSQGQALAAGSTPVVLTAAQITTLTPPAAIVGFALEAGHLATIDSHIPALGQALAAASIPVILPAATVTTLTPPAAITGFALDATLTTRLPAALDGSGFLKVHEQGTAAISAASLPLPTGAATSGNQTTEIASLATLAALSKAEDSASVDGDTGVPILGVRVDNPAGNIPTSAAGDYSAVMVDQQGRIWVNSDVLGSLLAQQSNVLNAILTEIKVQNALLAEGLNVRTDIDSLRTDPYYAPAVN